MPERPATNTLNTNASKNNPGIMQENEIFGIICRNQEQFFGKCIFQRRNKQFHISGKTYLA